jgi:hypothetical protein
MPYPYIMLVFICIVLIVLIFLGMFIFNCLFFIINNKIYHMAYLHIVNNLQYVCINLFMLVLILKYV